MQGTVITVPLSFLVQLYAPLAGLLVVVFWLGVLSQRVRGLESRQETTDAYIETHKAEAVTVAVLASKVEGMKTVVEQMEREMRGLQRTLATAFFGKGGGGFTVLDSE